MTRLLLHGHGWLFFPDQPAQLGPAYEVTIASRLAGHLEIAALRKPLSKLRCISALKRRTHRMDWKSNTARHKNDKSISDFVNEQILRTLNAVALTSADENIDATVACKI